MKQNEIAGVVNAIKAQVDKIRVEVQNLKDSLANQDVSAETQASLDALSAAVKVVDDINPDAPTTT